MHCLNYGRGPDVGCSLRYPVGESWEDVDNVDIGPVVEVGRVRILHMEAVSIRRKCMPCSVDVDNGRVWEVDSYGRA